MWMFGCEKRRHVRWWELSPLLVLATAIVFPFVVKAQPPVIRLQVEIGAVLNFHADGTWEFG